SSRRRHTRFSRDWSSDVCSSDLNEILGKPESKQHAFVMWAKISGRKHDVFSGVCVRTKNEKYSIVVRTQVEFQSLTTHDMESYRSEERRVGQEGRQQRADES